MHAYTSQMIDPAIVERVVNRLRDFTITAYTGHWISQNGSPYRKTRIQRQHDQQQLEMLVLVAYRDLDLRTDHGSNEFALRMSITDDLIEEGILVSAGLGHGIHFKGDDGVLVGNPPVKGYR